MRSKHKKRENETENKNFLKVITKMLTKLNAKYEDERRGKDFKKEISRIGFSFMPNCLENVLLLPNDVHPKNECIEIRNGGG